MPDNFREGDKQDSQKGRQGARWGQERRLEFIDYRLRWDGQINRSSLTDFSAYQYLKLRWILVNILS